jgi:hypothetical protein
MTPERQAGIGTYTSSHAPGFINFINRRFTKMWDQAIAWSLPLHTQGAWIRPLSAQSGLTSFPAGYEFLMQNCTRRCPYSRTEHDQNLSTRSIRRQNMHFWFLAGRIYSSRSCRDAHQGIPSPAPCFVFPPTSGLAYRSGSSRPTIRSRSHLLIKCTRLTTNLGGTRAAPSGTRSL